MRKLRQKLLMTCMLLAPIFAFAQEKNYQAYWVHEDRVRPAATDTYEQISKDLVAACKEHAIKDTGWITVAMDDNSYLYLSPINNFADLDKNSFATLAEKMGSDNMGKLFSRYDECYDQHGDYVIYLLKDMSYMPGGISQTVEGQNYRVMYYNYVSPENDKNFREAMKNIKSAFEKHNSKLHYRVYKSGFGVMGDFYMVAVASADPGDMNKKSSENWDVMKSDFEPLLKEMNKYTWKVETKRGWMRPEMAYKPE